MNLSFLLDPSISYHKRQTIKGELGRATTKISAGSLSRGTLSKGGPQSTKDIFNTSTIKKELLMQKQAKKDENLMRQLALKAVNKDVSKSTIFSTIYFKQRKKEGILVVEPNPQGEQDDEEDEEEPEELADDFLDRDMDCEAEIRKAKIKAGERAKNLITWSGQDVLEDFDPQLAKEAIGMLNGIRVWP